MKKNRRILLFAALIVLLLGLTALAASATDYYQVTNASGQHVGYYQTGADAVAAVTANGYTIKLLGNVNVTEGLTFSGNYACTLNGNGYTINLTGIDKPSRVNGLTITNGQLTVKNLTLTTTHADLRTLIAFNSASTAASLTLENTTVSGGKVQLLFNQNGTVLIKGGRNVFRDNNIGALAVFSFKNNSKAGKLTIEGGEFSAASDMFDASGATIEVKGGTFTLSDQNMFLMDDNDFVSAVNISGGTFNMRGGSFVMYSGKGDCTGFAANGKAAVNISGGTVSYSGGGPLFKCTVPSVANKTSEGGTMYKNGNYPVISISGGTFNCWPDSAAWEPLTRYQTGDAGIGCVGDMFYLDSTPVRLNISGGVFIGSPYTYSLVETRPAGSSTPSYVNISGGTFTGTQCWMRTSNASVWTISGDCDFSKPGPQTYKLNLAEDKGDLTDLRMVWAHNGSGRSFTVDESGAVTGYDRSAAGVFNFNGGTFTVGLNENARLINAAGADFNVKGGTFTCCDLSGFQMSDGDMISYVRISGGTFNGIGSGEIINYGGNKTTSGKTNQHGLLEISGGTFNAGNSSTAVYCACSYGTRTTVGRNRDGYVTISGGTFTGGTTALLRLTNDCLPDITVSGGTFNSTSSHLVNTSSYKGEFCISGGTFRLMTAEGKSAGRTDSIVYIKGTGDPTLILAGGTFINDREGVERLVLVDTRPATVIITGGTYLSRYTLSYFVEHVLGHGNMPFKSSTVKRKTVDGTEYYAGIVYTASGDNAPRLETDVTVRVDPNTPGIRFTSCVSHDKIAALLSSGAMNITYGTLIAPQEYILQLTNCNDVHGQLRAMAQQAGVAESRVFADVVARDGVTTDAEGNVTFRAALVGIKNVSRGYGAVSYVKATVKGATVYYYSCVNLCSNVVTLKAAVAHELLDVSERVVEIGRGRYVYKYGSVNDDGYSRYTQEEQNRMRRMVTNPG